LCLYKIQFQNSNHHLKWNSQTHTQNTYKAKTLRHAIVIISNAVKQHAKKLESMAFIIKWTFTQNIQNSKGSPQYLQRAASSPLSRYLEVMLAWPIKSHTIMISFLLMEMKEDCNTCKDSFTTHTLLLCMSPLTVPRRQNGMKKWSTNITGYSSFRY
jgi:hypothetical protein